MILIIAVAALAYGAMAHVHEAPAGDNTLEPVCTWCLVAPSVVFLTVVAAFFLAPRGFVVEVPARATLPADHARRGSREARAPPRR